MKRLWPAGSPCALSSLSGSLISLNWNAVEAQNGFFVYRNPTPPHFTRSLFTLFVKTWKNQQFSIFCIRHSASPFFHLWKCICIVNSAEAFISYFISVITSNIEHVNTFFPSLPGTEHSELICVSFFAASLRWKRQLSSMSARSRQPRKGPSSQRFIAIKKAHQTAGKQCLDGNYVFRLCWHRRAP